MKLLISRIVSGGLWSLAGKIVTGTSILGISAILTRQLAPEEVGAYLVAFSIVTLGALVGTMGLHQAVIRLTGESSANMGDFHSGKLVLKILFLGTMIAVCTAIIYGAAGQFLALHLFDSVSLSEASWFIAIWLATTALQQLVGEVFRGFCALRLASIFSGALSTSLAFIALGVAYILDKDWSLKQLVQLHIIATVSSVLIALYIIYRRTDSSQDEEHGKHQSTFEMLKISIPMCITGVIYFLGTQADLWVVAIILHPEDVALYGASSRLINFVVMPLMVVNLVVQPYIVKLYFSDRAKELEQLLQTAATLAGLPVLIILLGIVGFGENILRLVFGEFYTAGLGVLVLLAVGRIIHVWAGSCGLLLTLTGHQLTGSIITFSSFTISIGLAYVLGIRFGVNGVAIGTSIGLILMNLAMTTYGKRRIGVAPHMSLLNRRNVAKLLRANY